MPLGTACILVIWVHHHANCTCQLQGKCLGLRASSQQDLRMRCEHALGRFFFASGRYRSTFQQSLFDGKTARKNTGETKRRLLAGRREAGLHTLLSGSRRLNIPSWLALNCDLEYPREAPRSSSSSSQRGPQGRVTAKAWRTSKQLKGFSKKLPRREPPSLPRHVHEANSLASFF